MVGRSGRNLNTVIGNTLDPHLMVGWLLGIDHSHASAVGRGHAVWRVVHLKNELCPLGKISGIALGILPDGLAGDIAAPEAVLFLCSGVCRC